MKLTGVCEADIFMFPGRSLATITLLNIHFSAAHVGGCLEGMHVALSEKWERDEKVEKKGRERVTWNHVLASSFETFEF